MPKGSAVIYRDYDDPRRRAAARRFAAICRSRGVLLLIGDDASLAEEIGADGVHLPARALGKPRSAGEPGLLTASCHSLAELHLAAEAGADLAVLGPAFETESHPGLEYLGAARFRALAAAAPLPVLALGGVDEANASLLSAKNVVGLAAIGAFVE